jgi:hypothetical protein
MKIAYLVLCHADPQYIARMCRKLMEGNSQNSVFLHVDRKSTMMQELSQLLAGAAQVFFTPHRVPVYWGGYSLVQATLELMRQSMAQGDYDRFVLLQGADYPIKSSAEIDQFFTRHADTEFIKACDATASKSPYLYSRARYRLFCDRPTFLKKAWNRLTRLLDLKLHSGHLSVEGQDWHVYWGCAQIALTRNCVSHILKFENNQTLRSYFGKTFAADELYFHTIVFNSSFRERTSEGGVHAETPGLRLVDMRNLCYFEYPRSVTTLAAADFERLRRVPELYIRKVTSAASTPLLDKIDAEHRNAAYKLREV